MLIAGSNSGIEKIDDKSNVCNFIVLKQKKDISQESRQIDNYRIRDGNNQIGGVK